MVTADNARRRVSPLAPEDRRAALIEATIPLLREHGLGISTRQIADAAGVAEGTIFRAFPDKNSLIVASVIQATEPTRGAAAMERILEADLDLRARVVAAIDVFRQGAEHLGKIFLVIRELMTDPETKDLLGEHLHKNRDAMAMSFIALFMPDSDRLRVNSTTAARMTMAMVFMTNGHFLPDEEPLTSEELAAVLLDGLLRPTP